MRIRYLILPGLCATLLATGLPAHAQTEGLPEPLARQLPADMDVIASAVADLNGDSRPDYVIALAREDENAAHGNTQSAPARPLLLFTGQPDGTFVLAQRNDLVVFRADQGGQCDPFIDNVEGLVAKGRYFTVQNGVSCGSHWTDFITFRYEPARKNFEFYKRIVENWKLNDSPAPDAEALVLEHRNVTNAVAGHPVRFSDYRP